MPRTERYLKENTIVVGVIPGPHEPKKTINSYLSPLVKELNHLWDGVTMESTEGLKVIVRAALLCTSCDIPASRKVSGFVGHNAYRGCSRCLKTFPTEAFGQKPDYTGTDRSYWTPRDAKSHRQHALDHKHSSTLAQQKQIERDHGCRYSVLTELPYYNVIQFSVIDPMHNLLLGTAKHILTVWMSIGVLNKGQFISIQNKVDSFSTPSEIGRIPLKILSGFSGFTAEQWRNWTLIYSLFALKETIPSEHYDCWLLFVKATSLLCQREVTIQQVNEGDFLIMEFCKVFEQLYGKQYYTMNLHLHGHLKDCILDYGPVYSFWLFSFERLNGILGSYHTNCREISLQLMRKFTSSVRHGVDSWPAEYRDDFSCLLTKHEYVKGSLQACSFQQALLISEPKDIKPLPPVHETAWKPHQKLLVCELFSSDVDIQILYDIAPALSVGGRFILGSSRSRFITKSHVLAMHPKHNKLYLAKIEHFAKVVIQHYSTTTSKWIACVSFYHAHDYQQWFGGPTSVWTRSVFENSYILLTGIHCQVAISEADINFGHELGMQTVFVVSRLSNSFND